MAFYSQTIGQTNRQNNIMEVYFKTFVNYELDDWTKFLPIVEFANNNAKNACNLYTLFEFNFKYHP